MRKQTDLDEVKRTAITLLHTDIYLTFVVKCGKMSSEGIMTEVVYDHC